MGAGDQSLRFFCRLVQWWAGGFENLAQVGPACELLASSGHSPDSPGRSRHVFQTLICLESGGGDSLAPSDGIGCDDTGELLAVRARHPETGFFKLGLGVG